MDVSIYTLTDPRTGCVRYVGKTYKKLSARLANHIYDARRVTSYVGNWIFQLKTLGLKPAISLIDVVKNSNDTDWQAREVYWISHFRRVGAPLTNLDSGGTRGKCMSEASKEKCRIAQLKRGPISDEQKQKIRECNRNRVFTDEIRRNISFSQKGKKQSQATISKRSQANRGKKRSEETKRRMRLAWEIRKL